MNAWQLFLFTASVALLCSLLFILLGPRWGLLDHPGGRKDHADPVPIGGGLALYVALVTGCVTMQLFPSNTALIFAAAIIVVAGFADDLLDVSPRIKLLAQGAATLVMIFGAGIELKGVGNLLGLGNIAFGLLTVPVTIFAALGVINAFNMADGMDGLCGTMALVAMLSFSWVASHSGHSDGATTLVIVAGASLGFLLLNLRIPGRGQGLIFLGDAGSMLLGFLLAWYALELTQGPKAALSPIAALWVVILPLCDCVSLLIRRLRAGQSPFRADRQHLHHYLLNRGLSVHMAHALITIASLACAGIGLAGWYFHLPETILFVSFVLVFIFYHGAMSRAFPTTTAIS